MPVLSAIAARWQQALPVFVVIGLVSWFALFEHDPTSDRALFAALLVVYMLHQIEEHLWPGGFRQFTNAHVFHSGNDDWPVNIPGVALVNIGYVWLPVGLAALFPQTLRWLGLAWVGLTLINALTHIATSIRFRIYNPGLVTSIVLFLPFTIFTLALEAARGALSGAEIALIVLAGIVLHIPVAALFVVPFRRQQLGCGVRANLARSTWGGMAQRVPPSLVAKHTAQHAFAIAPCKPDVRSGIKQTISTARSRRHARKHHENPLLVRRSFRLLPRPAGGGERKNPGNCFRLRHRRRR